MRENIDYEKRLFALNELAQGLPKSMMKELLENGRLDEYYGNILEAIEWVRKMVRLHPDNQPYVEVKEKLDEQRQNILRFYQKYFNDREHDIIGSSLAGRNPDFIFALACRGQKMLSMRLEGALTFVEKNQDAHFVLCGRWI